MGTKTNGLDNAINTTSGGLNLTIDNSNLYISNASGRGLTLDNTTLTIKNSSTITISDCSEGEIYAKTSGTIIADSSSYIDATITQKAGATGTISITGGTYTSKVNTNYLPTGYLQTKNEDGTYLITKEAPIVEVQTISSEDKVTDVTVGVKNVEEIKNVLIESLESNQTLSDKIGTDIVKIEVAIDTIDESGLDTKVQETIKEKVGSATIATYFDITIAIKNASDNQTIDTLDKLNNEIELMVLLPEELKNTNQSLNRVYYVVREHNNQIDLLEAQLSEDGNYLIFKSDRFSTYALAYEDITLETVSNPKTFDGINTSLVIISLLVTSLVGIGIKIRQKLVSN